MQLHLLLPIQPHSFLCISRHRAQICRLETIIRLMFVRHLVPGSSEHLAGSILLTPLGLLGGRDLWAGKGACSMHPTQQHRWHVWATSHTFPFNLGYFWRSSFLSTTQGSLNRSLHCKNKWNSKRYLWKNYLGEQLKCKQARASVQMDKHWLT